MITAIATFQDQPQFTEEIAFGDGRIQIQFTWRERLGAWYFDIYDTEGNAIILGRRVSEGWTPLDGHALADSLDRTVSLLVQGPSPYAREDLGARLMLLLVPDDEITAAVSSGDPITITVAP